MHTFPILISAMWNRWLVFEFGLLSPFPTTIYIFTIPSTRARCDVWSVLDVILLVWIQSFPSSRKKTILMLNWIVWKITVYMYKNGFGINNLQLLIYHKPNQTEPNQRSHKLYLETHGKLESEISNRRKSSRGENPMRHFAGKLTFSTAIYYSNHAAQKVGVSSWYNCLSYWLRNRSERVQTPVTLFRSLSDKHPWERYETPYPPCYGSNSTTILLLERWLWH